MAGDNFLFYITCKRGRLFLEGDSFKYCWLSFPSKYFVIFAIKLKNNHSKETEHGLSQSSKFGSLIRFSMSIYITAGNVNFTVR